MHAVHCKLEDNNGFQSDSCPNVRYIPKFYANDIQLDIWQDVRNMFIFDQHHWLCVDTGIRQSLGWRQWTFDQLMKAYLGKIFI